MYSRFWWGCLREKGLLGRPRRRWEENSKMDLQKVELGAGEWVGMIWFRIGSDGSLL